MCVKEFYGFICGHCSIPFLRRCPISTSDPRFPPCQIPAERPINILQNCHPCFRVLWKQGIIAKEEIHRGQHERRECECETIFDEEERQRRMQPRKSKGKGKAIANAEKWSATEKKAEKKKENDPFAVTMRMPPPVYALPLPLHVHTGGNRQIDVGMPSPAHTHYGGNAQACGNQNGFPFMFTYGPPQQGQSPMAQFPVAGIPFMDFRDINLATQHNGHAHGSDMNQFGPGNGQPATGNGFLDGPYLPHFQQPSGQPGTRMFWISHEEPRRTPEQERPESVEVAIMPAMPVTPSRVFAYTEYPRLSHWLRAESEPRGEGSDTTAVDVGSECGVQSLPETEPVQPMVVSSAMSPIPAPA